MRKPRCPNLSVDQFKPPLAGCVSFDYRTATEDEIMVLARRLEGMTLNVLWGHVAAQMAQRKKGKGDVGAMVESYFCIPSNSIDAPDFPGAQLELKTVPLKRAKRSGLLRTDQRTKLTGINPKKLSKEQSWRNASVRCKMDLLLVFFDKTALPWQNWYVHSVSRWSPELEAESRYVSTIRKDWNQIRSTVAATTTTEFLSERDQDILAASSCGTAATDRCFSLKPWFNQYLFTGTDRAQAAIRAVEALTGASRRPLVGTLARQHSIDHNVKEKNWASSVIRLALGARTRHANPPVVAAAGLELRCISVSAQREAIWPLSLGRLRPHEMKQARPEESTLLSMIQGMLIVPLRVSGTDQRRWEVLSPVHWKPTAQQLGTIEKEWKVIRHSSRGTGKPPSASESSILFAKRKGTRYDVPDASGRLPMAFWVTRPFLNEILNQS